MFSRMLKLPDPVRRRHDLSSLEFVVHAAAPCPVPVKEQMIDWWGPIVHEYYGATEGTGTLVDSATWLARPGTVGRPDTPDHIRVLDEAGQALPPRVSDDQQAAVIEVTVSYGGDTFLEMPKAADQIREIAAGGPQDAVYVAGFGGLVAVKDMGFEVRGGEIVGLIGPNGSGKSTVMKCVVGIERPTSGSVRIAGQEVAGVVHPFDDRAVVLDELTSR